MLICFFSFYSVYLFFCWHLWLIIALAHVMAYSTPLSISLLMPVSSAVSTNALKVVAAFTSCVISSKFHELHHRIIILLGLVLASLCVAFVITTQDCLLYHIKLSALSQSWVLLFVLYALLAQLNTCSLVFFFISFLILILFFNHG